MTKRQSSQLLSCLCAHTPPPLQFTLARKQRPNLYRRNPEQPDLSRQGKHDTELPPPHATHLSVHGRDQHSPVPALDCGAQLQLLRRRLSHQLAKVGVEPNQTAPQRPEHGLVRCPSKGRHGKIEHQSVVPRAPSEALGFSRKTVLVLRVIDRP